MRLDLVDIGLLQVGQVADSHFGVSHGKVDREHLPQRG